MRAKLSFNVLANAANFQPDKLLDLLKRYPVAWLLVMNNLEFARAVKALDPGINVIYRSWPDDDAPTQWDAVARLRDLIEQVGDLDCWLYTNNESGFSDHVLDWLTNIMQANRNLGYNRKLIVGNFSSGTPNPNDWKRPAARRFIETINANRDYVRLGLHEYMGAVWTSGFTGGIQPEQWPTSVAGISTWHVGRWRFLQQACREMSIECPKIVITEHGMDDTSDIKPWLETLVKTPPFPNIRGWKSCINQWAAWWPRWTAQRAYFEQVSQADKVIYAGSPVEAQLIFSWADSGRWVGFDVQEADELHTLLIDYGRGDTMNVPESNQYYRLMYSFTPDLNLRLAAGTAATRVGTVASNDVVFVKPTPRVSVNGHIWNEVDVYRNGVKIASGWMAVTYPGLVWGQPVEAPTPETTRVNMLTKDEMLKLAVLHRQMAEVYEAAAARATA